MPIQSEVAFRRLKDPEVKRFFNFNTFFINIATMYRNNYTKEEGSLVIFKNFVNDISFITRYIEDFVDKGRRSIIVFYYFDYRKLIPKNRIRENTNVSMFKDISTILNNIQPSTKPELISSEQELYTYMWNIGNELPYKALKTMISNNAKIALVSHIAWDFFLFNTVKGALIESYTGNIFRSNEINKKVFKEDFIPFNPLTYHLLGDKYLFKPILTHGKRKSFDELAEKHKFQIKTQNEIKSILLENKVIAKEDLDSQFV